MTTLGRFADRQRFGKLRSIGGDVMQRLGKTADKSTKVAEATLYGLRKPRLIEVP